MRSFVRLVISMLLVVGIVSLCYPAVATAQADSVPVLARREDGKIYTWKDPDHARFLSWILPGAGHIYDGDYAEGYTWATLDLLVTTVGIYGVVASSNCEAYDCRAGTAMALSSIGVSLIMSALSASSAYRIAEDNNRVHRLGALPPRGLRPFVAVANGRTLIGLAAP